MCPVKAFKPMSKVIALNTEAGLLIPEKRVTRARSAPRPRLTGSDKAASTHKKTLAKFSTLLLTSPHPYFPCVECNQSESFDRKTGDTDVTAPTDLLPECRPDRHDVFDTPSDPCSFILNS